MQKKFTYEPTVDAIFDEHGNPDRVTIDWKCRRQGSNRKFIVDFHILPLLENIHTVNWEHHKAGSFLRLYLMNNETQTTAGFVGFRYIAWLLSGEYNKQSFAKFSSSTYIALRNKFQSIPDYSSKNLDIRLPNMYYHPEGKDYFELHIHSSKSDKTLIAKIDNIYLSKVREQKWSIFLSSDTRSNNKMYIYPKVFDESGKTCSSIMRYLWGNDANITRIKSKKINDTTWTIDLRKDKVILSAIDLDAVSIDNPPIGVNRLTITSNKSGQKKFYHYWRATFFDSEQGINIEKNFSVSKLGDTKAFHNAIALRMEWENMYRK